MKLRTALLFSLLAVEPVSAAKHSVTLNWNASTTPGVTYNVRRSGNPGGPFLVINPAPIALTSYVDYAVTQGATYYYVATAVVNGQESGYSNMATAVIPKGRGVVAAIRRIFLR